MIWRHSAFAAVSAVAVSFLGGAALADSISPTSYSADLAVGEKVTITKTVKITSASPTDALVDVMFVFDTTGSMGSTIAGAKAAAASILADLDTAYGSVASGVGYYGDPTFNGVLSDLATNTAGTTGTINSLFACYNGDCGGDFAELGNAGIDDAANRASWRPGSNRFIVALGDATFKDTVSDATVIADLAAKNITLLGLDVSSGFFSTSLTELGGTAYPSGTSPAAISAAILAGISAGFANYDEVTVGDLGVGLPGIGVTTKCLTADIGVCDGATAKGTYDRSVDRTFTYEVTFERLAAGDSVFDTHALVDGGIVASERDSFKDGGLPPVPLPAAGWMMLAGIGSLVAARRRKA